MAADGGFERVVKCIINEGYNPWRGLKSVLGNRRL